MTVSLDSIPKDSLVYNFITAGKKGRCSFCSKLVDKIEAHHVSYSPEIVIKLCHHCHHKVHYWPSRLNESEKAKLLLKKFPPSDVPKILERISNSPEAFRALVAPSRSEFIRLVLLKEKKPFAPAHRNLYK